MYPKEECSHIVEVLRQAKQAVRANDVVKLKDLSNQTVHLSCSHQDSASITIAVVIYALSKLIERGDHLKIKKWNSVVDKLNASFDAAIKNMESSAFEKYEKEILRVRQILAEASGDLKPYIQDVLKKAEINKGSRIYEHGISLEQTANLLGVSIWELSDYVGQKTSPETKETKTMDTKKRAKMAMEFFG